MKGRISLKMGKVYYVPIPSRTEDLLQQELMDLDA